MIVHPDMRNVINTGSSALLGARSRLNALTISVMLAFAAVPVQSLAQETAVQISLPSQSLNRSLIQLGEQASLQIFYLPETVRGLSAPPVAGNLTPDNALRRLLSGTGIEFRRNGRNVSLTRQANSSVTALAPIIAQASSDSTTEGSGSYTTTGPSTTATKLGLTLRETPQAMTVITRQRIEDQGLSSVNDVVQTAPGLTFRRFGPERASFYSRGMYVDNIMYDGLPVSLDGSYLSQDLLGTDMSVYDRVEIVRGAAGMALGAGNPAAAINLIRKRPTKDTQVSLTGSAGNWDRYRTELDASGSLDADGTLRGRAVVAYQKKDSYKHADKSERKLMYGILEKDFGPQTTFTLSVLRQEDDLDGNGFTGLPVARDGSDLHLPRSTSFANDWEYWNKTTTSIYGSLEHRFDNDWKVNLSAYHSIAKLDMLGNYIGLNIPNNIYTQYGSRNKHIERQNSYDLYASGPFELFGRQHELVFGGNYRKVGFDGDTRQGSTLISGMDIYNWDSGAIAKPDIPLRDWFDSDIEQKSVYATTRLNLADRLKLILGARLDWFDYEDTSYGYANFNANTPSSITRNKYGITRNVTKYAGLIFDLDNQHSVYASYTDIFKPQSYLDANQTVLAPIKGKNYELGIKGEYFNGALNASATLFRLDQANRAYKLSDQTTCSGYPSQVCYAAAGLVRSQGVELEVQGAISPNWQVAAGYTYTSAKYREDANPLNVGQPFDTDTPRHLFKLSSSYQLTGDWHRWRVGGSVYWQSTIYNEGTSSGVDYRVEQKSYAIADLMIGYQATPKLDVRLNINNLFDKKYYSAITGSVPFPSNVYGEPRSVILSLNYKL